MKTAAKATDILSAEHTIILQVLECLEHLGLQAAGQGAFEADLARQAVDFLGEFADRCHHGKEEQCLFVALERRGLPRHVGPLAVMLGEHDMGRELRRGMLQSLEDLSANEVAARQEFARQAQSFADLLRDHIDKEENVLFPMGDSMLGPDDQAALLKAFENVEHHDIGAGVHERWLAVAEKLSARFGVKPREGAAPSGHGGCGHGGCRG